MKEMESSRNSFINKMIPELLFLVVAGLFSYYFASLHIMKPEWEPASFQKLVEGTAQTPFQYRILIPFLVHNLMNFSIVPVLFVQTARGLCYGLRSWLFLVLCWHSDIIFPCSLTGFPRCF